MPPPPPQNIHTQKIVFRTFAIFGSRALFPFVQPSVDFIFIPTIFYSFNHQLISKLPSQVTDLQAELADTKTALKASLQICRAQILKSHFKYWSNCERKTSAYVLCQDCNLRILQKVTEEAWLTKEKLRVEVENGQVSLPLFGYRRDMLCINVIM